MSIEEKVRKLMREFDVKCPSCGSCCLGCESETDTDIGIMDEIVCTDCDTVFMMISSVNTQFVITGEA